MSMYEPSSGGYSLSDFPDGGNTVGSSVTRAARRSRRWESSPTISVPRARRSALLDVGREDAGVRAKRGCESSSERTSVGVPTGQ